MKKVTGFCASALTTFLLGSTALQAAVTADEVWQNFSGYYSDMGIAVSTGTLDRQGDTLVASNVTLNSEAPEGNFTATIERMAFRELGDGRVEVTIAGDIPFKATSKPATGEPVDLAINVTQTGLTSIVSGEANDLTYTFDAPEIGISASEMMVDGNAVPMKIDVTMFGSTGNYRMVTDGGRKIESTMSSEKLDFAFSATAPKGEGTISGSGSLAGLSGSQTATIPDGIDMADINAVMEAGFATDASFAYQSGGYVMDFQGKTDSFSAQSTAGAGALDFSLSKDGLSYGVTGKDAQLTATTSAFPMPIDLSIAESAFKLAIPVAKSETAQPFSLLVKLADFEVSEGLWAMIDPTAQLPRDPATLIADLSGSARLMFNMFDPAAAESMAGKQPGELEMLDINELKLSAVGSELTGTGALTFDNAQVPPKPIGAIDLRLVGGNALIDKLVALGFVPEDQAMGARMMMGLFAVPSGEDTLTSKIEFKEDGGIYANDQRIQ